MEELNDVPPENNGWMSTLYNIVKWCPTSASDLHRAEDTLLSYVTSKCRKWFVNIGSLVGKSDNYIRTISIKNENSERKDTVPLVLVHGFASAVGLWILNLDSLSDRRSVYAMDLLGFGRSSRPVFSTSAEVAEAQYVESIERWRQKVGIEKFVLLGHSLGAYLASAYALTYPDRVAHLILADPWGFPERSIEGNKTVVLPFWKKTIISTLQLFNPLGAVRAAGPLGPSLIEKIRGDIPLKFETVVDDNYKHISNYIYHCNAQTPSGEVAFKTLSTGLGWAKRPMVTRIGNLRKNLPLTLIYGSRSWIDRQPGIMIKFMREKSYVNINVIQGSGHHVYADNFEEFNSIIHKACELTDAAYQTTSEVEQTDNQDNNFFDND